MATFLIGLVVLFVGAAIYGKFCEKVFGPDEKGCHRKHTLLYAQFPGQILALS